MPPHDIPPHRPAGFNHWFFITAIQLHPRQKAGLDLAMHLAIFPCRTPGASSLPGREKRHIKLSWKHSCDEGRTRAVPCGGSGGLSGKRPRSMRTRHRQLGQPPEEALGCAPGDAPVPVSPPHLLAETFLQNTVGQPGDGAA